MESRGLGALRVSGGAECLAPTQAKLGWGTPEGELHGDGECECDGCECGDGADWADGAVGSWGRGKCRPARAELESGTPCLFRIERSQLKSVLSHISESRCGAPGLELGEVPPPPKRSLDPPRGWGTPVLDDRVDSLNGFEVRGEVAEEWSFVGEPHAADAFAVLEDFEDDFD